MSIPKIKFLNSYVDDDGTGEIRLLMDDKHVKYVSIEADLYRDYELDGDRYRPSVVEQLPPLVSGNWNEGRISSDPATGQPRFSKASKVTLRSIKTTWHPTRISHLDLQMGQELYINTFEATCPQFDFPVMVKFAPLAWEMIYLEHETTAYSWLRDSDVGLTFLGHLTEGRRVIGFITTRETGCRPATVGDYAACRSALSKLHALGIRHGDISKRTFRIRDGQATLVGFEYAEKVGHDTEKLEREMGNLLWVLEK
ncbi:hypothetical protein IMZ48_30280 [Candidatus Bathyarchaeota archaeon]|nr:hypothetical protein [Candidatus Bathyarchaeota archaeon]